MDSKLVDFYLQQSKVLNDNEPQNLDENYLKTLSAAEFNSILASEIKNIKENIAILKAELCSVINLVKTENDCIKTKNNSLKDLLNIYQQKSDRLKHLHAQLLDSKTKKVLVENNEEPSGFVSSNANSREFNEKRTEEHSVEFSNENNVEIASEKSDLSKAVRKPSLSDYNFSAETLAYLNDETVSCNSSTKKRPTMSNYAFYSRGLNNNVMEGSAGVGAKIHKKHHLHSSTKSGASTKITPSTRSVVITSDGEASSRLKLPNKRLTHSGSLEGSIIKMTPRFEFDSNFGGKLENPDFDSAGDDTTTLVTMIQRPDMPFLTSNLDNQPIVIRKCPEMPKLLCDDLLNSPVLKKENKIPPPPVLGSGAFKPPISKHRENATSSNCSDFANNSTFYAGDKKDVRQSFASDANVTYVISSSNSGNSSGHISKITLPEYSSLEPFIAAKISFNDLTEAVTRINSYLDQNGTELLTRADLADILYGHEQNLHFYTCVLTKFCRLKKLIADETYFSCL